MDCLEFTRRDWAATETDEELRLAVVGYGRYAENFARSAIERADHARLTVLVSDSVSEIADEDVRCIDYAAFQDGAERDAYDAVYVCTPNAVHERNVQTAARFEKPVLVEKPLAASVEGARRMREACANAGVLLMAAYRTRLDPVLRGVRRLVRDGAIGTPRMVHTSFSFCMHDDQTGWRVNPELSGGGALVDVGVYPINTIRWLLDETPASVQATTDSPGAPFDDVERDAHLQLRFDDAVAAVSASFGATFDSTLRVKGTDGVVAVTPAYTSSEDRTVVLRTQDGTTTCTPPRTSELVETFDYFASRVLEGEPVEPDGADGLVDLSVVEAAYRSAESGSPVEIEAATN